MTSPFPGMNPYLEQPSVWEDFHNRFAAYAGESLAAQVRPHFLVKLEDRVFIHEPSGDDRRKLLGRPDVALLEGVAGNSTAVATVTPEVNIKFNRSSHP
jgi:hypothetical protein